MARERQAKKAAASASPRRRSGGGHSRGLEPAPWDRILEETPQAYAAFRVFCDQRVQRSYVGTARALGKHDSQIRRWAGRFHWRERAHAWDLAQTREVEVLVRQEREQAARRRIRHAEQIERMAMAGIGKLVTRDRGSGEPQLSALLTPAMAVKLYGLALKIDSSLSGPAVPEASTVDCLDPLTALSDGELQQIIGLAKERAKPEKGQR